MTSEVPISALKEWAIICKALEEGRQVVLLRKGGILEYKDGFKLVNDRFLLFPTMEHQSSKALQVDYAHKLETILKDNTDEKRNIAAYAEVSDIRQINDKYILSKLEKYHIWNKSYLEMRMNYNPKKSMNMIILRVYKMNHTIPVYIKPEWSGCKSWISIEISGKEAEMLEDHGRPVFDDEKFQQIRTTILETLNK
jgi:hypothetical protein